MLILYGTSACHLCEQAQALVEPQLSAFGVALRHVDISDEEALVERYGVRIPVLACEHSEAELGWPFDEVMVGDFIARALADIGNV